MSDSTPSESSSLESLNLIENAMGSFVENVLNTSLLETPLLNDGISTIVSIRRDGNFISNAFDLVDIVSGLEQEDRNDQIRVISSIRRDGNFTTRIELHQNPQDGTNDGTASEPASEDSVISVHNDDSEVDDDGTDVRYLLNPDVDADDFDNDDVDDADYVGTTDLAEVNDLEDYGNDADVESNVEGDDNNVRYVLNPGVDIDNLDVVPDDESIDSIPDVAGPSGRLAGNRRSAAVALGENLDAPPAKRRRVEDDQHVEDSEEDIGEDTPIQMRCPVCLDRFVDIKLRGAQIVSTQCGHIFCKCCVQRAMANNRQCPACRKPISRKRIRNIYI